MITDSIKNSGSPDKGQGKRIPGLSNRTIEIIAGYKPDQLKKMYERYSIRYLMREVSAWVKLGKQEVAETIKSIIAERMEASRIIKMSRLTSNIKRCSKKDS